MTNATEEIQKLIQFVNMIHDVVHDDPLDALGAIFLVEKQAKNTRASVVKFARDAGYSWKEIGDTLNTSAEDAQKRYDATSGK